MNKKLLLLFLMSLALRLVVAPLIWHPDLNNHVDWGIKFFEYGADRFYAPESNVWAFTWPNQPPGTILIFAAVRKIYEFLFNIVWQINTSIPVFPSGVMTWVEDYLYQFLLKVPSIASDVGIAYLIYRIVNKLKNRKSAYAGAVLYLVNPVIWYNSTIWGQTDAIINFFGLLSLLLLLEKKPVLASLAFAICLYIKISLLIFLPIFVIMFLRRGYNLKTVLSSILVPIAFIIFATLPFAAEKEPIGWLVNLYSEKVLTNQLQIITANAFNLWAALTGIHEQPHSLPFAAASYQAWGIILFLVAFLPLLYKIWKIPKPQTAIWVLALTSFSSWMLLTNMHERYLYPLFPYLTIIVVLRRNLLPLYIGISGINLLNLYNFWWRPEISIIKNIMSAGDRVAARILGGVNLGLFIALYWQFVKARVKK